MKPEDEPLRRRPLTPEGRYSKPSPGRGGYRPGSGRKKNSPNRLAQEAVEKAKATGILPHEFLLKMVRGEVIYRFEPHPDPEQAAAGVIVKVVEKYEMKDRKDAAIGCAPYFASKLHAVELISGVTDDQLDEFIARAAAEAGISLGSGGEGAQGEDPER